MPFRRTALLTALSCLVLTAPAAASERSEARQYAAAMDGLTDLTAEEAEALVVDMEARAAHVAAACMPSVQAAAKRKQRREWLSGLYAMHLAQAANARFAAWLEEADAHLAPIAARTRVLRRGRAQRQWFTGIMRRYADAAPPDFCASVTAWERHGFKGRPREVKAVVDVFEELFTPGPGIGGWLRAEKLLKHHGATRAQRKAFAGEPDWPELREPAPDPVADLLDPKRDDGVGSRHPW